MAKAARSSIFIADGATYVTDPRPLPEDVAQIIFTRFCR